MTCRELQVIKMGINSVGNSFLPLQMRSLSPTLGDTSPGVRRLGRAVLAPPLCTVKEWVRWVILTLVYVHFMDRESSVLSTHRPPFLTQGFKPDSCTHTQHMPLRQCTHMHTYSPHAHTCAHTRHMCVHMHTHTHLLLLLRYPYSGSDREDRLISTVADFAGFVDFERFKRILLLTDIDIYKMSSLSHTDAAPCIDSG